MSRVLQKNLPPGGSGSVSEASASVIAFQGVSCLDAGAFWLFALFMLQDCSVSGDETVVFLQGSSDIRPPVLGFDM